MYFRSRISADAKDHPSACSSDVSTQQTLTPHYNHSQHSIIFTETDVVDYNLPIGSIPMSGQEMISQQGLTSMPNILQPYGLIPQQNYLYPYMIIQPQGIIGPQTFLTAGVPQIVPMVSNDIPPFMSPSTNAWQVATNAHVNLDFGQYGYGGHMQWPLQPEMSGYGNLNQQEDMGSFVPSPENMTDGAYAWPDMHSGESSNNTTN